MKSLFRLLLIFICAIVLAAAEVQQNIGNTQPLLWVKWFSML